MDFARALEVVSSFLEERRYRLALIGGLALAVYRLVRATLGLDMVVEAKAQEGLTRFLEERGYRTLHRSEGYSNHLHGDPAMGRIDFVYVRGDTIDKLFSGARLFPGPNDLEIPVPKEEHLAAMKVLAMKNDPTRAFQELADIRFLLTRPRSRPRRGPEAV